MKEMKVVIKEIPIDLIDENTGQIPEVPENPRRITDEDFELLKRSIQESPEMKQLDEVKVFPYNGRYIAIGGNHRTRAYKELGWKNVLCKSMRGVRSSGEMTVSVLTGLFKNEPEARREFYKLIDAQ